MTCRDAETKSTKKEREITLFIDLHGHSRRSNVFSYGCDSRHWKDDSADRYGDNRRMVGVMLVEG